jgi:hypothetical protein
MLADIWFGRILVIVCSVLGSGGLWAFLQSRDTKRNATTRLLMGVAYDKITTLGLTYIERGSITKDELEDFRTYFFEPYAALGGNGVAKRIMREVETLPFRPHSEYAGIFQNREHEGPINNVRLVTHYDRENTSAD